MAVHVLIDLRATSKQSPFVLNLFLPCSSRATCPFFFVRLCRNPCGLDAATLGNVKRKDHVTETRRNLLVIVYRLSVNMCRLVYIPSKGNSPLVSFSGRSISSCLGSKVNCPPLPLVSSFELMSTFSSHGIDLTDHAAPTARGSASLYLDHHPARPDYAGRLFVRSQLSVQVDHHRLAIGPRIHAHPQYRA